MVQPDKTAYSVWLVWMMYADRDYKLVVTNLQSKFKYLFKDGSESLFYNIIYNRENIFEKC